ncbi:hypothetical protein ACSQ67_007185 [Phaseolus vulgaris]
MIVHTRIVVTLCVLIQQDGVLHPLTNLRLIPLVGLGYFVSGGKKRTASEGPPTREKRQMASSSSYNSPCAACKFLRRKCMPGCIFAPYFPPEEPQKFANVHKIFGASNVTKLLNELLPQQREDAVNSLAYEAEARVRDPVYGCVGAISFLQRQVQRLQKELDAANADLLRYSYTDIPPASLSVPPGLASFQHIPQRQFTARFGNETGFYRQSATAAYSFPYAVPWTDTSSEDISEGGGGGGHL